MQLAILLGERARDDGADGGHGERAPLLQEVDPLGLRAAPQVARRPKLVVKRT